MKKIIIFITLLIFIPFFIVIIYNKNYKEIELKYISTTYIRVKQLKKEEIIKIPLEEYIVGVVAGEMPVSFHLEALKAQAVAARNYAIKKVLYNKDNEYDFVYERQSKREKRSKSEIGIHAVRGGTIVGEHTVLFAGKDEVIEIKHSAASREVFATGAIRAAEFLSGKPAGMYNMNDLIGEIN